MANGLLHHLASIASSIPYRHQAGTNTIAAMAVLKDGVVAAASDEAVVLGSNSEQNEVLSSQDVAVEKRAVDDGRWRGGIKNTVLDCPVEAAWDLVSDWGRWSWYTQPDSITHAAGEHRKAGCVRVIRYPAMWVYERALVIDNDNRILSYAIDENDALGGLKGYSATTQFQATSDGKTLIPYWDYEMDPLENFTPETFQAVLESIFKPIFDELEKGAQRLAAGVSDPTPTTET